MPIALSVISFLVALGALRWIVGREDQLSDEVAWGLSVLGAGTLLFIGVFITQLALAPSRLERAASEQALAGRCELQAEIDALRSQLQDKRTRREISQMFGVLQREGKELLHRLLEDEQPNIGEWGQDKDDWRQSTTAFLEEYISAADAANWDGDHLSAPEGFEYNGRLYTGDKGRLAHQIALLLRSLSTKASGY